MDERAMSEYVYCSHGEPLANDSGEIALAREGIVRCRDCKWFSYITEPPECYRVQGCMIVEPDGFCTWAERKEVAR